MFLESKELARLISCVPTPRMVPAHRGFPMLICWLNIICSLPYWWFWESKSWSPSPHHNKENRWWLSLFPKTSNLASRWHALLWWDVKKMESWVGQVSSKRVWRPLALSEEIPKWHLGWVSGCEWVVSYSYGREVSEILIPLAQTSQKPEQPVRYGRQELEIRNLVVQMNFSDCF